MQTDREWEWELVLTGGQRKNLLDLLNAIKTDPSLSAWDSGDWVDQVINRLRGVYPDMEKWWEYWS